MKRTSQNKPPQNSSTAKGTRTAAMDKNREKNKSSSRIPVPHKKAGGSSTHVRPVPDFSKLHRKWENKFQRGKACTKRPNTVVHEFDLTSGGMHFSPAHVTWQGDADGENDPVFQLDQNALDSIVNRQGLTEHSVTGRATIAVGRMQQHVQRNLLHNKLVTEQARSQTPDPTLTAAMPTAAMPTAAMPTASMPTAAMPTASNGSIETTPVTPARDRFSLLASEQQTAGLDFESDPLALRSILDNTGVSNDILKMKHSLGMEPATTTAGGASASALRSNLFKTPAAPPPIERVVNTEERWSTNYTRAPRSIRQAVSEYSRRTRSRLTLDDTTRESIMQKRKEWYKDGPIAVPRERNSIYKAYLFKKTPTKEEPNPRVSTYSSRRRVSGQPLRVALKSPAASPAVRVLKTNQSRQKNILWKDLLGPQTVTTPIKSESVRTQLYSVFEEEASAAEQQELSRPAAIPPASSHTAAKPQDEDEQIRELERRLEQDIMRMEQLKMAESQSRVPAKHASSNIGQQRADSIQGARSVSLMSGAQPSWSIHDDSLRDVSHPFQARDMNIPVGCGGIQSPPLKRSPASEKRQKKNLRKVHFHPSTPMSPLRVLSPNISIDAQRSPKGMGKVTKPSSPRSPKFKVIRHESPLLGQKKQNCVPSALNLEEQVFSVSQSLNRFTDDMSRLSKNVDKENIPVVHSRTPSKDVANCSNEDLNSSLSESMFHYEKLQSEADTLRKQDHEDNNILKKIELVKQKQEELVKMQQVLQFELLKRAEESSPVQSAKPKLFSPLRSTVVTESGETEAIKQRLPQKHSVPDTNIADLNVKPARLDIITKQNSERNTDLPKPLGSKDMSCNSANTAQKPLIAQSEHLNDCSASAGLGSQTVDKPGVPAIVLNSPEVFHPTPCISHTPKKALVTTPQTIYSPKPFMGGTAQLIQSKTNDLHQIFPCSALLDFASPLLNTPQALQSSTFIDNRGRRYSVSPDVSDVYDSSDMSLDLSPMQPAASIQLQTKSSSPSLLGQSYETSYNSRIQNETSYSRAQYNRLHVESNKSSSSKFHNPTGRGLSRHCAEAGELSMLGNMSAEGPRRTSPSLHRNCAVARVTQKYRDALLDDEVALYCNRHPYGKQGHLGLVGGRCDDPVAKLLREGDERHFIPIQLCEIEGDLLAPSMRAATGSAFSLYT